jgi:hypothetical protein
MGETIQLDLFNDDEIDKSYYIEVARLEYGHLETQHIADIELARWGYEIEHG